MFKIILATVSTAFAQTLKAGLKTTIEIAILEQAKDVYFQKILDIVNGMELPDLQDADGNYLKGNSIEIIEGTKYVEFVPDVKKNAVVLKN